jgi:DNA-binding Lrp family transcriptional regulator
MDDTDRKMMLLVEENPRMPLKELANRLRISRQATDHRLQILAKAGAFKGMRAFISMEYLNMINVSVWGKSTAASMKDTLDRLGESEFTVRVVVAGENNLSILGCLRNLSELNGFFEFVKRAAEMPDATVGVCSYHDGINPDWCDGPRLRRGYKELSTLDLRIIASLNEDARKPAGEIADEVGVSVKTARRHIERMISDGSLEFDIHTDLPPGEDMVHILGISLRSGADRVKVGRRLLSKYPVRITLVRSFTNIPDYLRALLSSDKMSEIRRILKEIGEDEDVLAVTPNLIYLERVYETTWDVKMLMAMAYQSTKPAEGRLNSELRVS